MSSRLEGATAVVTAGSKGHSAGIAEVLTEDSTDVRIMGRDWKALDVAACRLGLGGIAAAVTKPAGWDKVFDAVLNAKGWLNIMVNNAGGVIRVAPIAQRKGHFPISLFPVELCVFCVEIFFVSLQTDTSQGFAAIQNKSNFLKFLVPACPG